MTATVVISGGRSMPALEMARAFKAAGMRTVATDSVRHAPAAWSNALDRYVRLPGPNADPAGFAGGVRGLLDEERPFTWIPTCEEVFHLATLKEEQGVPVPLLAPSLRRLEEAHDKLAFSRLASPLGLAPAVNLRVDDPAGLRAIEGDLPGLVLKPIWSRFGERVLVRPSLRQASTLQPSASDPWLAQSYLPGEEACTYAVASAGEMLAYAAYRSTYRAGRSATVHFAPYPDAELRQATRRLVAALAWDGQIAFDLRRDAAGSWKVIECNPRATSGVHILMEGDLAASLLDRRSEKRTPPRAAMLASAMAFYALPNAVRRGRTRDWSRSFREARDVAWTSTDRRPGLAQFVLLAELLSLARKGRMSLLEAATWDLEWNPAHGLRTSRDLPKAR